MSCRRSEPTFSAQRWSALPAKVALAEVEDRSKSRPRSASPWQSGGRPTSTTSVPAMSSCSRRAAMPRSRNRRGGSRGLERLHPPCGQCPHARGCQRRAAGARAGRQADPCCASPPGRPARRGGRGRWASTDHAATPDRARPHREPGPSRAVGSARTERRGSTTSLLIATVAVAFVAGGQALYVDKAVGGLWDSIVIATWGFMTIAIAPPIAAAINASPTASPATPTHRPSPEHGPARRHWRGTGHVTDCQSNCRSMTDRS